MARRPRRERNRGRDSRRRRERALLRLPIVNILLEQDGLLVLSNGERIIAAEVRGRYRVQDAALLFTL
jgi:hypothetical protein